MSHLGVVGTIALASKSFFVVAFDSNPILIENMQKGKFDFSEPGMQELFVESQRNIRWTSEVAELIQCDIVFVSLDIYADETGTRDDSQVNILIEKCLEIMSSGKTLVINSQVTPGTTRRNMALARTKGISIFYQVETLIFGEAIQRALYPERIIVGSETQIEFDDLPIAYRAYLNQFNTPVLVMNFESAELTKISINLYLIFSIAFSDTLSTVATRIGANWESIVNALRLDARIGKRSYLRPSLGLNGINLMRDLRVIEQELQGVDPYHKLIIDLEVISKARRDFLLNRLEELTERYSLKKLFFLGMAYKEGTASLVNSPMFQAYEKLNVDFEIDFYDSNIDCLPDGKKRIDLSRHHLEDRILVVVAHPITEQQHNLLLSASEGSNEIYILDPFGIINFRIKTACRHYESLFEIRKGSL